MPQHDDVLVTFASASLADDRFFVASLHGHEAISQVYEFELALATPTPLEHAEFDGMFKHPAAITLSPDPARKIHGVIRAVESVPQPQAHQVGYVVTLVPRLWYLSQSTRSRVFLNLTVPDVIKRVLTEAGLESGTDYDVRCTGRHPSRSFIVQFEETDLDFLQRWMEHEGIFYYFTHEGDVEKLVVADASTVFENLSDQATVTYAPAGGTTDLSGSIQDLRVRTQVIPRKLYVRDYDTDRPDHVVQNDSAVPVDIPGWPSDRTGHGLQVLYGENVPDGAEATRVARLRAEESRGQKVRYDLAVDVRGLHPGHKLTVADHFVEALNQEYVLLSARHEVEQEGITQGSETGRVGYHIRCEAITSATVYRPPVVTPRPRVRGVINATVDGNDPKQNAHIDDHGRYRLVLPFDTVAKGREAKATIPVRMAQPYAGPGYGMHFPLHQGAEVLVAFIDGDPDRPVIVGSLPNPQMASPITAPRTTRGAIYTRSQVRIEYDDDA